MLSILILGSACNPFFPQDVRFTFDNRTDDLLCYYPAPESLVEGRCLQELSPQDETAWAPDCDGDGNRPITVIIALRGSSHDIFRSTESCAEWHDTNRKFTIEETGAGFVVTPPQ